MSDSSDAARAVSDNQVHQLAGGFTAYGSGLTARQMTYDALVLDARLRQSLTTVRSLGSRGLHVAALGGSAELPTFSSRWCHESFVCPAPEGAEACFSHLEQVLDNIGVGVLIASSDATIALLRRHREQLEQRVCLALAKEPALSIAMNKARTTEIAKWLGIRVPHAVAVGAVSEVDAALHEVGLPAIIKPVESWVWNAQRGTGVGVMAKLVTTSEDARNAVEMFIRLGATTLFQEFVPGRRESVSLVYAHGGIYARYAQRHTRIVGGQSSMRESIAIPLDIGNHAERLVREIELEGCSEVEFRRDHAGNAYLMEINPRLWASTQHAVLSGIDFPYLLYQWARGERIDVVKNYRVGTRLRYLPGHYEATVLAIKRGGSLEATPPLKALLDFFLCFFIPATYDYVDGRDPLPAWVATSGFMRYLSCRLGERLLKMLRPLIRH